MTYWILLPVTLVLLCSSSLCSLICDLTQGFQEDFVFLNQMSTSSLVPCLKDRINFNFPKEVMEGSQFQRKEATVIVHEMFQQIFTLFSQNAIPATWNQIQVTQLLSGLNQQLEQLEKCHMQDVVWKELLLGSENARLALKSYFQGINQYLQRKGYSHCSWEIVRVEIRRAFMFMSKFTRKFRD